MHAGFQAEIFNGFIHDSGSVGGENLRRRISKGMPRNLLTVAVADGSKVVVPMRTPEAMVTSGRQLEADVTAEESKSDAKTTKVRGMNILDRNRELTILKLLKERTVESLSSPPFTRYVANFLKLHSWQLR
jgi:hypothetical protein